MPQMATQYMASRRHTTDFELEGGMHEIPPRPGLHKGAA
jgi:hypothetical protein